MEKLSEFKYIASGNFAHVFHSVYTIDGETLNVAIKLCFSSDEHSESINMEHFNNVMINEARTRSSMVAKMTVEYYPRLFMQKIDYKRLPAELVSEMQRVTVNDEEDVKSDMISDILSKFRVETKTNIYDQCVMGADVSMHFSELLPKCVSLVTFVDDLVNNKKTFYGNSNVTSDIALMQIITQIIVFLSEMQSLDPEFTHNDLVPNVFIQPLSTEYKFEYKMKDAEIEFKTLYRVRIIDFGSSRFSVDLRNNSRISLSQERSSLFAQPFHLANGIGTVQNNAYDVHSLLNYIFLSIRQLHFTFPTTLSFISKCITSNFLGLGLIDDSDNSKIDAAKVERDSEGDLYNGRMSLFPRFFYDRIMETNKRFKKENMVQFMQCFHAQEFSKCIDLLPAHDTECRNLLLLVKKMYDDQEYQQLSSFCSLTTTMSNEKGKEIYYVGNRVERLPNILKKLSLEFRKLKE